MRDKTIIVIHHIFFTLFVCAIVGAVVIATKELIYADMHIIWKFVIVAFIAGCTAASTAKEDPKEPKKE